MYANVSVGKHLLSCAPTGQVIPAQGNALGYGMDANCALKGQVNFGG